jgi:hypothetical protein
MPVLLEKRKIAMALQSLRHPEATAEHCWMRISEIPKDFRRPFGSA